ncbi:uncharacterized protein PHACADRAFT_256111 [Phanerochaete carnosa HHB-10118-sp]|uniref:Uncharacterized protein n=1 Tax=Phanerochaete carnosa (strain HHB-10118-sp) TaxID=650164 RepID=K5UZ75_PHACS|nr:uncharacterized protein PHACADRAFT_256111 [Phanerochaete carnosa HHB-10118-sp]EKM55466.1 hypothetical protein PHACADRAFT_256111 [Phanerochaete carnosa HHB-10118-sp]
MDMFPPGTRVSYLAENGVVMYGTVHAIVRGDGGQSLAQVRVDGDNGPPREVPVAYLHRV